MAVANAFTPSLGGLRSAVRTSRGGISPLQADTVADGETFTFEAEVSRVMTIIINSLYSNRDVFLRELVSNAADACDKRRFLSIGADGGEAPDMKIRVSADKDSNTLVIEDNGIGMTRDELKNNLGRIAQSGTAKFMEALSEGADTNLIGQFGVGFYSGFLVADRMDVYTRSFQAGDSDPVLKWSSSADQTYTIAEANSEDLTLGGAGTKIVLHLKEDAEEYLEDYQLGNLLRRYSEFITFPIELWEEKVDYEQVPDPDAEVKEGEEPKMKTETVRSNVWSVINKSKPIWMRSPREVNETEYSEFYKSTFYGYDDPLGHTHFSVEGQVEFRALLYIPSMVPFELSRNLFDEKSKPLRLYVKRVFINDNFEALYPRWLTFVRGVVDSEDLPLNVGREILQQSKMLTVMNKRLVRKTLDMIRSIKEDETKWAAFKKDYGRYMKVGIVEDPDYKDDLAPLCTFFSSQSGDDTVSLDEYLERTKPGQQKIYYVTGESRKQAELSPAVGAAKERGFEVLYMTDALDELAIQGIAEYGGKTCVDLGKDGVELEDEDEEEEDEEAKKAKQEAKKKEEEELKGEFQGLCEFFASTLAGKVNSVTLSKKLADAPAMLVQGAYGMSPTMQRYMQSFANQNEAVDDVLSMGGDMDQSKLELNPKSPIILALKDKVARGEAGTAEDAKLVYDLAAMTGGYNIDDPAAFAKAVQALLTGKLGGDGGDADGGKAKEVEVVE